MHLLSLNCSSSSSVVASSCSSHLTPSPLLHTRLFFDKKNRGSFGGDRSRLARYSDTAEWAMWRLTGVAVAEVWVHYWPGLPVKNVTVSASADGVELVTTQDPGLLRLEVQLLDWR